MAPPLRWLLPPSSQFLNNHKEGCITWPRFRTAGWSTMFKHNDNDLWAGGDFSTISTMHCRCSWEFSPRFFLSFLLHCNKAKEWRWKKPKGRITKPGRKNLKIDNHMMEYTNVLRRPGHEKGELSRQELGGVSWWVSERINLLFCPLLLPCLWLLWTPKDILGKIWAQFALASHWHFYPLST